MKNFFEENKTKLGLAAIAAALIALIIVIVCNSGGSNDSNDSGSTVNGTQVAEGTEVPQITPIFMYFVSKSDEGYDDYMKMIDELKAEYEGRVEFDIRDIDENPEDKENFPVDGQTPVLIMNNHDNNITAIEFKCVDKAKLKEDIEGAF